MSEDQADGSAERCLHGHALDEMCPECTAVVANSIQKMELHCPTCGARCLPMERDGQTFGWACPACMARYAALDEVAPEVLGFEEEGLS